MVIYPVWLTGNIGVSIFSFKFFYMSYSMGELIISRHLTACVGVCSCFFYWNLFFFLMDIFIFLIGYYWQFTWANNFFFYGNLFFHGYLNFFDWFLLGQIRVIHSQF